MPCYDKAMIESSIQRGAIRCGGRPPPEEVSLQIAHLDAYTRGESSSLLAATLSNHEQMAVLSATRVEFRALTQYFADGFLMRARRGVMAAGSKKCLFARGYPRYDDRHDRHRKDDQVAPPRQWPDAGRSRCAYGLRPCHDPACRGWQTASPSRMRLRQRAWITMPPKRASSAQQATPFT